MEDKSDKRLMGHLVRLFAKMANLDGEIGGDEIGMVRDVLATSVVGARHFDYCAQEFVKARRSRKTLAEEAMEFVEDTEDEFKRAFVYEQLWDMAGADGVLRTVEKQNLRTLCGLMRLPDNCFELNYRRRRMPLKDEECNEC